MKLRVNSCLLLIALCWASDLFGGIAPKAPNIVIIFADDMPPSHVGAYGGRMHTPAIDSLAKGGTLFTEAFCVASMCTPSRYSLLTGRYPGRCRAESFNRRNPPGEPYCIAWNTPLVENEMTLGKLFSTLGYQTGMVGKWHLGEETEGPREGDLAEDVDVTDPQIQNLLKARHERHREEVRKKSGFQFVQSVLWQNFDNDGLAEKGLRAHNFEWILKGALEFLDGVSSERPFLLYFASTALHGPEHSESIYADASISPEGHTEVPSEYYPSRSQIIEEVKRANKGMRRTPKTGQEGSLGTNQEKDPENVPRKTYVYA